MDHRSGSQCSEGRGAKAEQRRTGQAARTVGRRKAERREGKVTSRQGRQSEQAGRAGRAGNQSRQKGREGKVTSRKER